ncbi:MAG: metallophosphoesterase, partial [Candidatus Omnitrophica bacterium]|nr:metallophosphoesterase [Candidatus Omnitrophota bacterium]
VETMKFELNRHRITVRKKLPRPIRILHLSDTHFAGDEPVLARFFDRLSREEMDFVFISGDIIDCDAGMFSCLENLKKLKPACGFFAVFGNHDYYDFHILDTIIHNFPGQALPKTMNHVDLLSEELQTIGVKVLRNETAEVSVEGVPVLIHGLDNPTTGHANIRKTMRQFDQGKVNFLLTHLVDVFLDIGENEIDVSFSGHSHGGQFRLPLVGPLMTHTALGKRYASGIWNIQGAVCCISRGLSSSRFFRVRLLCPPEAILLTVHGI